MFEKTDFYKTLEPSKIYVSLHDAVQHALHKDVPQTTEVSIVCTQPRCLFRRKW